MNLEELKELLKDNWFVDNPNASEINEWIQCAIDRIEKLEKVVAAQEEALKFYENKDNWFEVEFEKRTRNRPGFRGPVIERYQVIVNSMIKEKGERARQARETAKEIMEGK